MPLGLLTGLRSAVTLVKTFPNQPMLSRWLRKPADELRPFLSRAIVFRRTEVGAAKDPSAAAKDPDPAREGWQVRQNSTQILPMCAADSSRRNASASCSSG